MSAWSLCCHIQAKYWHRKTKKIQIFVLGTQHPHASYFSPRVLFLQLPLGCVGHHGFLHRCFKKERGRFLGKIYIKRSVGYLKHNHHVRQIHGIQVQVCWFLEEMEFRGQREGLCYFSKRSPDHPNLPVSCEILYHIYVELFVNPFPTFRCASRAFVDNYGWSWAVFVLNIFNFLILSLDAT